MEEDNSSVASSSQSKGRKMNVAKAVRSVRNAVMSTSGNKDDKGVSSRTRKNQPKQKDNSKDNEAIDMDAEITPEEQQVITVEIQQTEDNSFMKVIRSGGKEKLIPEEDEN